MDFIRSIFDEDEDNPFLWLGKVAVAVTVGVVFSRLGIPRLPNNVKF